MFVAAIFVVALWALPATRWSVRLWLAVAMPLATALLLHHERQPDDIGPWDFSLDPLLWAATGCALAGIGLRWVLSRLATDGLRAPQPLSENDSRRLLWFDQHLAVLAGLCAGLFLVLAVALTLRGASGGLLLHLIVALVTAGALFFILRQMRGLVRPAMAAALSVLSVMALLGGIYWPGLIESRAAAIAGDLPRCLRAIDRPPTIGETMLLTLPRGRPGAPGLILTVMRGDEATHYRWSYRASRFIRYGAYRHGPCPG
ncbi:MAG: hypothetical protein KL801_20305 [Mesorhizobium sp.]|nr:hypothetical protein [Mesorhizobium sp.]